MKMPNLAFGSGDFGSSDLGPLKIFTQSAEVRDFLK